MFSHILIYVLSFVAIWLGSGLAIKSVEKISRSLRASAFVVSFFVLGLFTSVGELSVGVNSLIEGDPEILIGNLIGASIVIFLLLVPLLALVGNSIRINQEFRGRNLSSSLLVIVLPVLLVMDGKVDRIDGLVAMVFYGFLLLTMRSGKKLIDKIKKVKFEAGTRLGKELLKIVFGVAIIFLGSKYLVEQTLYFSELLKISPFVIGLLLLALGTNIPELSLVVRTAFGSNRQVVFGDYIGSAAFNSFLFGLLVFINGQTIFLAKSYLVSLLCLLVGLLLFFVFARTKNILSRKEALLLLFLYLLFVVIEVVVSGYVG
ncbi:MAG: sodium:calcium antiporter [Patescibacteria group bacterium]